MAYNTKKIKRDVDGNPIPQTYNPASDEYEALQGSNGASKQDMIDRPGRELGKVSVNSSALPAGAATEAKQNVIIGHVDGVETALAALLTKAGFDAKQDLKVSELRDALRGTGNKTLADLASALVPLATAAKQDTLQGTLASILAKIIAAPATAAKQDTLIAKDFATQTTLAAILAKLIAAPATEAKQTALAELVGEAQANPAANTLLARLKALETKIDAITNGTTPAVTQAKGSMPEYNWFTGNGRPIPKDSGKPAIGVEVDAETGDMTGLLWNGENWEEV